MNRDEAIAGLGNDGNYGRNRPFKETHARWLFFHDLSHPFQSHNIIVQL